MPSTLDQMLAGLSFGGSNNKHNHNHNNDTETTSDIIMSTRPELLLTYECGHVIPLPTQQDADPSKKECRQCAWRRAFWEVREIRQATQRQAREIGSSKHMTEDQWKKFVPQFENDEMFDGIVIAERDRVGKYLDVQAIYWHRHVFGIERSRSNAVRDVLDAWERKWGKPTEREVDRWIHWKLQTAAEAESERQIGGL